MSVFLFFPQPENPGTVHFDSRTRAVMAGQDSHDNVKEKVHYFLLYWMVMIDSRNYNSSLSLCSNDKCLVYI